MIKTETLKIVRYPDEILRKAARPVDKITEDIFELNDQMTALMLEFDGVGLAATQVGVLLRLFIINMTPFEDKPTPMTVINPAVIDAEGVADEEEGCLSFPKLYLHIPRARKVRISMQNLYNERLVFEAEDFLARAVLHEIDHLNGVLFIDHVKAEESAKVSEYVNGLRTLQASP
jgi:peptide deformylase